MEYKVSRSEIKEVDKDGTVLFYASVFGNKDLGGDIIMPGAYSKTIRENFKNIRHFKHHDSWKMPGVVKEISEDSYGLLTKSQLILGTQLGRETYEEYKAMIEAGKSMDHSVGYSAIKWDMDRTDPDDERRILREIKLYEVSTLTAWGMNPLAQTVNVKSLENIPLDELLKEAKYFEMLLKAPFTDARLEQLEQLKNHVDSLIQKKAGITTLSDKPTVIQASELITNVKFF
jgi:HK97 family phage prohead protease